MRIIEPDFDRNRNFFTPPTFLSHGFLGVLLFLSVCPHRVAAQNVAVLTYHNDIARTGANTNETILTPANVNSSTFGQVFNYPVDGYVYAQPLILTNVSIPGQGTHNVVYVATEHDTVYAFDADAEVDTPYWTNSFLKPSAGVTTLSSGDVNSGDIVPEIGITSTPVIDPASGTLYVEVKTKEVKSGVTSYVHRLHALDITSGAEKFGGPVVIQATVPGSGDGNDGHGNVPFNGLRQMNRPGLLLYNGTIFLAYASHGDNGPYHGWLLAYNAQTLAQTGVYNSTPNGGLGGFWDAGNGPAVDEAGNIYLITGNGTFSAASKNYGDSYLKFSVTNGIQLVDYFTPYNQLDLANADTDVGSSGLCILPDSLGTPAHPHLLVGGSKSGSIYLLDRDNLGKYNAANDDQILQELPNFVGGMWCSPAYFIGTFYLAGNGDYLKAFSVTNAAMSKNTIAESPDTFGYTGASPAVSANGTSNAIVWALEIGAYSSGGPSVLHAYNATNIAHELYNSDQAGTRDVPGGATKYTVPTVANGKVYVGAAYSLSVFGNGTFLAPVVISPNGATFSGSVKVTLSEPTSGSTIYYTLDDSLPTTNSILYAGPFTLTNSVAVHARAFKAGAVDSAASIATFLSSTSVGNGTGLTGIYYSNQLETFNGSPTLTRIDPQINFNWNNGPPSPKISVTDFTVRWTGAIEPQFNETYTFYTTTDDGTRLWVNNQEIINEWEDQAPTTWSGSIALKAGQRYPIRMDYYQNQGGAEAYLAWSSPSTAMTIIPVSQLYPTTNLSSAIVSLTGPANGSTFTANASVTITANASNPTGLVAKVDFYANTTLLGTASNSPYVITATGLAQGSYALTAKATDGNGFTAVSSPINITVTTGSGLPYGLTARLATPAYLNLPTTIMGSLPQQLSQTGAFVDTPGLGAAFNLIPYNVNVPLWSDGALKTRWLAVPNTGGSYMPGQQVAFAPTGEWTFPPGTVFVKHFELNTDETNPSVIRRLETRLLVMGTNGVYGVTYKWRPDNSDADLLTSSMMEDILITNATGIRTQTWYYPSQTDCLTCHTFVSGGVLGVNTRQLNGNFTYTQTGNTDNQLRALNAVGLFYPAFDESALPGFEHLSSVTNLAASLEDRARSYLDANCAQCHQPNGVSHAGFDARYDTPLTNQNIINGPVFTSLGLDHASVVVPQDVWRSALYLRVNSVDPLIKMPPLARNLVDTNAVAVFTAWINSLPGTPALQPPAFNPDGGTFFSSVTIQLQQPNTNATIYYTLDGTLPGTNSLLYTGPFVLTNTTPVSASAFAPGYNNSAPAGTLFIIRPPVFFTSNGGFTNNMFQLQLSGIPGMNYIFQGTTDFQNWISLSTNTADGSGLLQLFDPGATNFSYRFYRAIEQP